MAETYRTILVAFAVKGKDEEDRQNKLMSVLPESGVEIVLENWWIAEDKRYDKTNVDEYDSAVFTQHTNQDTARSILAYPED